MTAASSISTLSMSHEIVKCSISNQPKESRRQHHHHHNRRQQFIIGSTSTTAATAKDNAIDRDLISLIPNFFTSSDDPLAGMDMKNRQIPSTMSSFRLYFIVTITLALCFLPTIASAQNISTHHHHHRHYYQLPTL